MRAITTIITATAILAGCAVPPPKTPQEAAARRVASAEYMLNNNCSMYVGGYGDARLLAEDLKAFRREAAKGWRHGSGHRKGPQGNL